MSRLNSGACGARRKTPSGRRGLPPPSNEGGEGLRREAVLGEGDWLKRGGRIVGKQKSGALFEESGANRLRNEQEIPRCARNDGEGIRRRGADRPGWVMGLCSVRWTGDKGARCRQAGLGNGALRCAVSKRFLAVLGMTGRG